MRILVAYATAHGQTRKIAEAMVQRMRERGHVAEPIELPRFTSPPELTGYDAVVLGSPLYGARHRFRAARFARARRAALAALPTAFFSVSLSAGSRDESVRAEAEKCVDRFVAGTGWAPTLRACFAGALNYREYNPVLRMVMRRIAAASGGDVDTTRNHEYTDWSQVEAFTDAFLAAATTPRKDRRPAAAPAQDLRAVAR
jgi:menaquinone-dependent protoporphyrinogen oxidase